MVVADRRSEHSPDCCSSFLARPFDNQLACAGCVYSSTAAGASDCCSTTRFRYIQVHAAADLGAREYHNSRSREHAASIPTHRCLESAQHSLNTLPPGEKGNQDPRGAETLRFAAGLHLE